MISFQHDGSVLFKVFLPHASTVEVVGDFTDWMRGKLAMSRHYPGWWTLNHNVDPGEHAFCYLVDGSIHLADYAAHGVALDAAGKWMSTLRVATEPAMRRLLTAV